MVNRIVLGDSLDVLPTLPERCARLAYLDPPFNTGTVQRRNRIRVTADQAAGTRGGFAGRRYRVQRLPSLAFADSFGHRYLDFLLPRIQAALRCLTPDGSLFVHLDWREVHYVKVALDRLLGPERFINEIIWAYDFGGRSRRRWPAKHDTILWYAMNPRTYVFDTDAIDRIPYMAPTLVTADKAARGKWPTDVWWHTIVPTSGREKTGYPTQKPLGLLLRIVRVHSRPGDTILDCFAGSGTTGEAAARLGRHFLLIDNNPEAVELMRQRLAPFQPRVETHSPQLRNQTHV